MTLRIADNTTLPELTWRGMILGALITLVFTGSNVYLGLKVGLTFASSIPAAVISMAVLRFFKNANILENNMVQTQASAAGTLSTVIFIIPGLVMIGYWQGFPFWQTAGISAAGGILGVMYTIPLRRAMVVQSDLPYPEGVAAAEILRVGSAEGGEDESGVREILGGSLVAGFFTLLTTAFQVFADEGSWYFRLGTPVFRIGAAFSMALLGAGYLVGMTAGIAILIGTFMAWGIAVPILCYLHPIPAGADLAAAANGLWRQNVRLIGAGTIATGALWTLIMLAGPVLSGMRSSWDDFTAVRAGRGESIPRTERDLPLPIVTWITLGLIVPLAALFGWFLHDAGIDVASGTGIGLIVCGVVFAIVFGFMIAAASGYMAGLVGSTNSPISGIGILGVTMVSLLVVAFFSGQGALLDTEAGRKIAIAVVIFITSSIVATACVANDNLQDLKTGLLVGATPWRQQVALIIGIVVGAAIIPPILDLLYNAYGFATAMPRAGMDPNLTLSAPQATLMTTIATGVIGHALDWTMIVIGLVLGVVLILADQGLRRWKGVSLPVLAVGMGLYLPPTVNITLAVGAIAGWWIDRAVAAGALRRGRNPAQAVEASRQRGTLLASGLIVGESLVGVVVAMIIGASGSTAPLALVGRNFTAGPLLGLLGFAIVTALFVRRLVK